MVRSRHWGRADKNDNTALWVLLGAAGVGLVLWHRSRRDSERVGVDTSFGPYAAPRTPGMMGGFYLRDPAAEAAWAQTQIEAMYPQTPAGAPFWPLQGAPESSDLGGYGGFGGLGSPYGSWGSFGGWGHGL
jgi:hypothetical protein